MNHTPALKRPPHHLATLLVACSLVTLLGCGGATQSALSPVYEDNRPEVLQRVAQQVAQDPTREPEVAVVVTLSEPGVAVVDLSTQATRWQKPADLTTVPFLCGQAVVAQDGSDVVVWAVEDGRELFRKSTAGMALVGAGGSGDDVAFALSSGTGVGAESAVYLLRKGSVRWSHRAAFSFGKPSVAGGLVFLPWANQQVSALSVDNGDEVARLRVLDGVIASSEARDGAVYLGRDLITRFGPEALQGVAFQKPRVDLPAQPKLMLFGEGQAEGPLSAVLRVRFALGFDQTKAAAPADDTLYFAYHKVLFGLSADAQLGRWGTTFNAPLVGIKATKGGALVMTEEGELLGIAPTGARESLGTLSLGPITYATFGTLPALEVSEAPSDTVQSLARVTAEADTAMQPARILALKWLADSPAPSATEELVRFCVDPGLPSTLMEAACAHLEHRTQGAQAVLTALEQHASFLNEIPAPPLKPLARAAASLKAVDAVPLLVAHLEDPATSEASLPMIVDALGELLQLEEAAPHKQQGETALLAFLDQYRSESAESALLPVLQSLVLRLADLDRATAAPALQRILEDPFAAAPLKGTVDQVMSQHENAAPGDDAAATAGAEDH